MVHNTVSNTNSFCQVTSQNKKGLNSPAQYEREYQVLNSILGKKKKKSLKPILAKHL